MNQALRTKVSAIVPLYNEEKTIAGVVAALLTCPAIDEVICVNDGSSDKSADILALFGDRIRRIDFEENRGKGAALSAGIEIANGEIVCFFDADVVNMRDEFVYTLLSPFVRNSALAGVLGAPYRYRASLYFPFNVYLSGQRAYRRERLLPYLVDIAASRFGSEVLLNSLFSKNEMRIVYLKGFHSLSKHSKMDTEDAIREYARALMEVALQKSKIVFLPYKEYPREIWAKMNTEVSFEVIREKIPDITRLRDFLK